MAMVLEILNSLSIVTVIVIVMMTMDADAASYYAKKTCCEVMSIEEADWATRHHCLVKPGGFVEKGLTRRLDY